MNRRRFLELASGAALGLSGLGCTGSTRSPSAARSPRVGLSRGPLWAEPTADAAFTLLPEAARPQGMLELYMLGGVSPWETYYTVPEHGHPDGGGTYAGQQWWSFQEWGNPTVPHFMQSMCKLGGKALYEPFGTDALGMTVNLGPFVMPLRDRPDILKRLRVWVLGHELFPHEAAIPYAISGTRLGMPQLASLGSHVQRFFQERAPEGRTAPYAYSIIQSLPLGNRVDSIRATGLHPASSRPIEIRLGPNAQLAKRLTRPNVSAYRTALDDLVETYTRQYGRRLTGGVQHGPTGLRAPGLSDFDFARATLRNHADLAALITEDSLLAGTARLCQGDEVRDETTAGLRLAASLLTAPENAAKYVQVIDSGIYPDPLGMGYDSHPEHVFSQGANIIHGLDALCGVINAPGENDPHKLDLDKHFVLVNTEFGRAPVPEYTKTNPDGKGTDHWPWGYVVVGFGGFADAERSGIVGAIGEDAVAVGGFTPGEHRAAMLLAMGIWPFEKEGFAVGEIQGADNRFDAAIRLREKVLGYPL